MDRYFSQNVLIIELVNQAISMINLGSAGVALAILLAVSPAAGSSIIDSVLLSPTDYVYLAIQGVERDSSTLQKMSPKELRRLHLSINDEKTQGNPQAKMEAVLGLLAEFEVHQQWEIANPGSLWDDKNRAPLGGASPNLFGR